MLEKVIEVLSGLFLRTSEQRAEKRAKENLVFLHQAFLQYQIATRQGLNGEGERSRGEAARQLLRALEETQLTLSALSPDTYDQAIYFVSREVVGDTPNPVTSASSDVHDADELGARIERLQYLRGQPDKEWVTGFEQVSRELRSLIGKHLTPGEIQRAQDDFYLGEQGPERSWW